MRIRTIAATSAFLITAGLLAPAFAQADASSATTLYVNNTANANCSDAAGLGTSTTPYCTIQAAANAAVAGDTVSVVPGDYSAGATITTSGTAAAPISFVSGAAGGYGLKALIILTGGVGFAVNGAQYVTIQDFGLSSTTADVSGSVVIQNSSNITVNGQTVTGDQASIASFASSDVTIERNQVIGAVNGTDIDVSGGGSGNVVTTNYVRNTGTGNGIIVEAVTDTAATSNTVVGGCTGISAVPGQGDWLNDITFENNIVANMSTNEICAGSTAISTDYSTNVTDNYNIIYPNNPAIIDYSWNESEYTTQAAFYMGTGQGSADLTANPVIGTSIPRLGPASPAIDSADSAAPGELTADLDGTPRVNDPLVPDTGAGPSADYDRGAFEAQDPVAVSSFTLSPDTVPVREAVTATVTATDTWGLPFSFLFDFGDGSPRVPSTSGAATHNYPAAGTYTVHVSSVVNGTVSIAPLTSVEVTVVPAAATVPALSVTGTSQLKVNVDGTGSTDSWPITGYSFDFGDKTPPVANTSGTATHTYAAPGMYAITMTITDAGGNSVKTSVFFRTAGAAAKCGENFMTPDLAGLAVSPVVMAPGSTCGSAESSVVGAQASLSAAVGSPALKPASTELHTGLGLAELGPFPLGGALSTRTPGFLEPLGCITGAGFVDLVGRPFECFISL